MHPHVRNDVKQSVGLVVTSNWVEKVDVSSISHLVKACAILSTYKPPFGDTEKVLIFFKLTAFMLLRQYWHHFGGPFFTGAYFPQKLDLLPRLESERKLK
jgi:hypothetical protein